MNTISALSQVLLDEFKNCRLTVNFCILTTIYCFEAIIWTFLFSKFLALLSFNDIKKISNPYCEMSNCPILSLIGWFVLVWDYESYRYRHLHLDYWYHHQSYLGQVQSRILRRLFLGAILFPSLTSLSHRQRSTDHLSWFILTSYDQFIKYFIPLRLRKAGKV